MVNVPNLGIPDIRGNVSRELSFIAQRSGIPIELITGAFAGPDSVPNTRARLSHAYTLRTSKSRIVGAVFRTSVRQSRDIDYEYENDVNANGRVAAIVPQIMNAQTFEVTRWDLYDSLMEEAFTDFELVMLCDQFRGFRLREVWRAPSILNSGRRYEYSPAYFQDLGREVDANNDRTVRVSASLIWLGKTKIQG